MLSKTALSVVKALVELAELPPNSFAGAATVAQRIDAPQNYLSKMLKGLVREQLVESQKGSGGGFRLSRRPERITLFDVVEPIDQVSKWDGCFLGGRCDGRAPCSVHRRWSEVRETYLEFLKGTTIADLAGK
jgi:Rrf2 family protein